LKNRDLKEKEVYYLHFLLILKDKRHLPMYP